MRRDMPCKPNMCMGPKVKLKPMSNIQKAALPHASFSL